jgi:hypothetical protein
LLGEKNVTIEEIALSAGFSSGLGARLQKGG